MEEGTVADTRSPAERYLAICAAGTPPDLQRFLEEQQGLTARERLDVVLIDQRWHWQTGRRRPAEDYLGSFPEIRAAPELERELVLGEWRTACEVGPSPHLEVFSARFPHLREALETQAGATAQPPDGDTLPFHQPPPDSDSSPVSAVQRFGDYQVIREIARGGMGVVYRAKQVSLDRTVALKMILAGQTASAADVQRFRREAEAAARLQHPNIVAIHEVGVHDGRHFFSMDFVDGASLEEMIRDHPLAPERAAGYLRTIAQAIHYAHQQGILHRDLKPSNVLIDQFDQPRITDFGIAKRIDDGQQLTREGDMVGTPSYMPPEQISQELGKLGPTADVYSLGAVLYDLLTGRPPFQASTAMDTLVQVLYQEPVSPRALNPKVPLDLETICFKSLQKEPGRRYPSAEALAQDLGRWLAGRPIEARPIGRIERTWRWCRRNPALALSSAAAVLLLMGTAAVSSLAAVRIRAERDRYEASFVIARDAVRRLTDISHELDDVANMEPLRRRILMTALDYQRAFLAQRGTDPSVRHETALALHRVGEITRGLGEHGESETAFRAAIAELEALASASPEEAGYRHQMAISCIELAELLRITGGDMSQAHDLYARALAIEDELARTSPDSLEYRRQSARTRCNRGIALRDQDRPAESEAELRRAIELSEALVREAPENLDFRHELARCHSNLGILLRRAGRVGESESAYQRAIESLEDLRRRQPGSRAYRFELAVNLTNLGNVLQRDAHRSQDSEAAYRRAVTLLADLSKEFPGVVGYRKDLGNASNNLGGHLARSGRSEAAAAAFEDARRILDQLASDHGDVPDHHHLLGGALGNLSVLRLGQARFEEARQLLDQAIACEQRALGSNPQHPEYLAFLRDDYWRLAEVHLRTGDHAAAARAAQQLPRLFPESWPEYHRAACLLARCIPLATTDGDGSAPPVADYAGQAMALLHEAIRKGLKNPQDLAQPSALAPLRSRDDFRQLQASLTDSSSP